MMVISCNGSSDLRLDFKESGLAINGRSIGTFETRQVLGIKNKNRGKSTKGIIFLQLVIGDSVLKQVQIKAQGQKIPIYCFNS